MTEKEVGKREQNIIGRFKGKRREQRKVKEYVQPLLSLTFNLT